MAQIEIKRIQEDFGFEATDGDGNVIRLDSSPDHGGKKFGVRPMQVLLMGLGGCSGIDIVSILKKQKQEVTDFNMKITGHREHGKEPSLWETVNITFQLTGNIDIDKAKRACSLSMDKYCSVAETLRRAGTTITWDVEVNNQ
jgi:putative redox protein